MPWKSNESVALVIQHAKRMRPLILSSVACLSVCLSVCLSLLYLSTLSHKRHNFRKTFIEYKMCALIFCTIAVYAPYSDDQNSSQICQYTAGWRMEYKPIETTDRDCEYSVIVATQRARGSWCVAAVRYYRCVLL